MICKHNDNWHALCTNYFRQYTGDVIVAEENTNEEVQSGGKSKFIIIGVVALLAIGGGAAFFLSGGEPTEGEAEVAEAEPIAESFYVALEPAFVVNFQDKSNKTKFLKAELNVVTIDDEVPDAIAKHMPAIRNNLILLFSRQIYEDLLPHDGKEALRAEALSQVQAVIEKQTGKPGVDDLFFTSFVMQ
ncbi:MAG: flagellar FliL protein [Gammaproteobacteria bacterium]|jgi:flagellar FliL protein